MAGYERNGRSKGSMKSFIAIERYTMDSAAWRSLSIKAKAAYLEILYIYNGRNNGYIGLSGRMLASKLSINRVTAKRALDELQEKGFIDPVKLGGFSQKTGKKRATEWRVTQWKCDVTGERPTKKYMKWHAGKMQFAASSEGQSGFTSEPHRKPTQ